MKKWQNRGNGFASHAAEGGSSYHYGGQQKRTLGTRRGVMNKFVPPIRTRMDE